MIIIYIIYFLLLVKIFDNIEIKKNLNFKLKMAHQMYFQLKKIFFK